MGLQKDLLELLLSIQAREGWNETELATRLGIDPARWSNWKRRGEVAKDGIELVIDRFGLPTGRSGIHAREPEGNYAADQVVQIKESEVAFKGGAGHELMYEILEDSEPASYRMSFFVKERMNPDDCIRFRSAGDSNVPFIFPGDTVLVHIKEREIRNGYTYAFWHEGEGRRIKKLFKERDGSLILRSWNPDYPDEVVSAADVTEKIVIIGRVRDRSGAGGLTGRG